MQTGLVSYKVSRKFLFELQTWCFVAYLRIKALLGFLSSEPLDAVQLGLGAKGFESLVGSTTKQEEALCQNNLFLAPSVASIAALVN